MPEFMQQIKEQVSRVWQTLSVQQKTMFIAAPVVLLVALGVATYLASRPRLTSLVTSQDSAQLAQIITYLDNNGIYYETPSANKILVNATDKPKVVMQLAGQDLIGPSMGAGFELFDQTKFGMTDRQFAMQAKRALQNELSMMIVKGADQITDANVIIQVPPKRMFKSDQTESSASVKLVMRGSLSDEQVRGIQNLVAAAVGNLKPRMVIVLNSRNEPLSEDSDVQSNVAKMTKQLEVKQRVENDLYSKLVSVLEEIVGPDNYRVVVNSTLDWEEKVIQNVHYDANSPAQVSGKEYSEENTTPSIAGPPGVDSNVQDTGIGAEGGVTGSSIEETISNFVFPWFDTHIKEEVGEIKKIAVSIFLNYVEDANGVMVEIDPVKTDLLKRGLRAAVGLAEMATPIETDVFTLTSYEFDTSVESKLFKQQLWQNVTTAVRSLIPMILLFALGYFAYIFFQRAFAPEDIEEEEEEEIPIEPVTEAKKLTLSQLGLAEFGDVASLPAEEQRRLKMQEHVINYAAEKPEEVAAIIKAWLNQ